ncbi:MAG: enoyl-CoA hydratase/isomerase family protein [Betaproteobacteria bacterium]|nr:enoyl-CoA hydratase/isomerase family protein [Betaproteobacteria bacterium]MCC6246180.1 enoyl-CoA hydratase/isomerase family protein [Rubrivivax sp.]MCL4697613.1 enoyl-CoA hydratase/isomerase family protein [Burkholderiaceae bacterium]
MNDRSIRIDKQGPVWRVVLNRPEVRNAHDLAMFQDLVQAFDEVEADPDCRVAVLAAEGAVFCAGQDLRFTRSADARQIDAYGRANVAARQRIQRNHKPVVAAVNGPAVGGGTYLATACDLVVAVDTAYFQMREIQAGNHAGGAFLFTVGRARSLEMSLLGRKVTAPQALAWGLINRCVPAAEFDAAVAEYVDALLELPPLAIRHTKQATNLLLDAAGFSNHLEAGGAMQRYLSLTPDGREAKRAFAEKREPRFTGAYPRPAED